LKTLKKLLCIIVVVLPCIFVSCQSLDRTRKRIDLPDKIVIFTFDDGPNPQGDTTARLLDVLKKYDIKAMFALLGENAEDNPELVRRIHDEGHYIINHGYCDSWVVNMGPEFFRVNLKLGEIAISSALGEPLNPRLYRPQGGFYKRYHRKIWRSQGYTMIPSTDRPHDAVKNARDMDRIVHFVVSAIEAEDGGIIMLHDGRDSSRKIEADLKKHPDGQFNRAWIPEAVEKIILALQEKGYTLSGFDALEVINLARE
jgi:peptidoglycan/xylan/chitin deacetylase (PgdA/CDA1 family)